MQVTLIAVGRRMPGWVTAGMESYTRRYPKHWNFRLREISASPETVPEIAMVREAEVMLAGVPDKAHLVALDEHGSTWSTVALAKQFERWQGLGKPLALCIGGPDGLDPSVRKRADQVWSLSALTLPHPLVRVVVAEQLYRAQSLLANHPYHRA